MLKWFLNKLKSLAPQPLTIEEIRKRRPSPTPPPPPKEPQKVVVHIYHHKES